MSPRKALSLAAAGALVLALTAAPAVAQPTPPAPPTAPAPAPQGAPQPSQQPSQTWQRLPHMQLERQFAGPLQDTIIQRWRDPVDGSICYIYLPITAQHSPPTESGFVQYGANTIGSISCSPGEPQRPAPHGAAPAPHRSVSGRAEPQQ